MAFEQALAAAAHGTGIRLLVLFGSRARGAVHPHSDWDFGYLGDGQADEELLRDRLMRVLETDQVDVVELSGASALLRFQVAAEGTPIFETAPGLFRQFQIQAVSFWCDVEPVLRPAYAQILAKVKAA